jgi:hypothetical protein
MKHTIAIPDWIWEYEQVKTGMKNPATPLRDRLARSINNESTNPNLLPDTDIVEFEDEFDYPTAITLERPGVCHFCKKLMNEGEKAFYFTVYRGNRGGIKVVAHPKHWEDKDNG